MSPLTLSCIGYFDADSIHRFIAGLNVLMKAYGQFFAKTFFSFKTLRFRSYLVPTKRVGREVQCEEEGHLGATSLHLESTVFTERQLLDYDWAEVYTQAQVPPLLTVFSEEQRCVRWVTPGWAMGPVSPGTSITSWSIKVSDHPNFVTA